MSDERLLDDMEKKTMSVKYLCSSCGDNAWEIRLQQLGKMEGETMFGITETRLIGVCTKCGHQRTFGKLGYERS